MGELIAPGAHVLAVGVHVPRLRLSRERIAAALGWLGPPAAASTGERAVCNWDEDALTLGVEAARGALAGAPARRAPGALALASTSLPFADRSNATLLAAALDLPEDIETSDQGGSLRAATTALAQAARRGDGLSTLVVGADARHARPGAREEMEFGAGAAAVLVGPPGEPAGETGIAQIRAAVHVAADFVDHYRMAGESFDYALEERWVRDEGLTKLVPGAVSRALRAAGLDASSPVHFVMPGPAAIVRRMAQAAGLGSARVQDGLRQQCGDCGAAHPLLLLAATLEESQPGDAIVLCAFGQGVDVLVLQAGATAPLHAARPLACALAHRRAEEHYTRYLSHQGLLQVDFGMRAERDNRTAHSVAWRKHRQLAGFVGGRCTACGTVQFPRARVCVDPQCRRTDTQVEFRLADVGGRLKSFTEDRQAYSPHPPAIYGNVEFNPGGNLLMELTDIEPGEAAVGDALRFVFRIKDKDALRGFRRYFWKATRS